MTTDDFRKFFHNEFAELKQKVSLMDELKQENADLKARVDGLTLEKNRLQEQLDKINASNLNSSSNTNSSQNQNTPAFSTLASQWADDAQKNKKTQNQKQSKQNTQKQFKNTQQTPKKKQFKPATEGMLNWAYRGFTEKTGPTGYQFIHIRNSARTNQRTVRRRLAIIGITNRRVLAVQFPTKGVTSLLVHNAYADEIKASLAKGNVTPIKFDPLHDSVICDPAHVNLSVEQKQKMATDIYFNRMTKLCLAIQPSHVGSSIMRYFNQVDDNFFLPDNVVTHFFNTRAGTSHTNPSSAPPQTPATATTLDDDLAEDDFMDSEEQQKQRQ
jgi:hypothetical protein